MFDYLRAALAPDHRLYRNVAWVGRTHEHGPNRDGEADLVIAHPERGILVIEVKAGEIARDANNRWWAGGHELPVPPQKQASDSKHALVAKLTDLPEWHAGLDPIAGHGVAFPDVDIASAGRRLRLLGPDLPIELILDERALASASTAREAVDRTFNYGAGSDSTRFGRQSGPRAG